MSGPLGSQQWMYSTGFYPYEIDQSLRFNDDDTAYLSRTPASAGNRKTWTYSCWAKRATINTASHTFGITAKEAGSNARSEMEFDGTANEINVGFNPSGSQWFESFTNPVFRDASAWYHIVVSVDMTQATDTDRLKVYVNGILQTFRVYSVPSQNTDLTVNNNVPHSIGRYQSGGSSLFDGYLAEVNFIDGQALDPTSFGEFKSGVWIPKSYSGTYGTNGFYLDFGNSGSLGADSSGNGNNWTPNNLAATDQVLDSPTNNFATFNPLGTATGTFSEGSLKVVTTDSPNGNNTSTISVNSGKWYAEFYYNAFGGNAAIIGVCDTAIGSTSLYAYSGGYSYFINGNKVNNNSDSAYGSSYTTGDIIGVSLDMDAGTVTFYKNGVSQGVAFSGLIGDFYFAVDDGTGSNVTLTANFGQDSSFAGNKTAQGNTDANGIGDFYYAPPSGYLALCTANLPDPVIDPAQDDVPADYFNTVLYTGDGTYPRSITGVGFQPDLVWAKARSVAYNNTLYDAVRGTGTSKMLFSNSTSAEGSLPQNANLSSFDTDGFSIGSTSSTNILNNSGTTFVAWNWKANGAGVSNTDGTITSTVSANQDTGMSIVTFTTDGSNTTVGTGLSSSAPLDMVIIKRRDSTSEWQVGHRFSGQGTNFAYHLELNSTSALSGAGPYFMGTHSASNGDRIYLASGAYGVSSATWVAYCFQSVEGFSKFGSYTGNGSADGPFVYTGFRPAFVMIKKATGSTADWFIGDSARSEYNPVGTRLMPNLSDAETATSIMPDMLSNGFKLRSSASSVNSGTITYIYMAFAEMPFKYSNAR